MSTKIDISGELCPIIHRNQERGTIRDNMSQRRIQQLQRQVAGILDGWMEPHGAGRLSELGYIKGVDITHNGEVKLAYQPSRAHCPCCLLDLIELRNAIEKRKGIENVHIEVIGIPANERWTKAVNE